MLRKIILPVAILALLAFAPLTAKADSAGTGTDPQTANGCYVYAPSSVNEGQTFITTIKCFGVTSDVFGIQFGTAFTPTTGTVNGTSGIFVATQNGSAYTAGDFAPTNFLVGENSFSSLYAVSHEGATTSTGEFTVATFISTAPIGLTSGNGSVSIGLQSVELSDNSGAPITVTLPASAISVTIKDIVIALRQTGSITVNSDGTMTKLRNIVLNLGGANTTVVGPVTGSDDAVNVSAFQYTTGQTSATMAISMTGHLSCTTTDITLPDGYFSPSTVFGSSFTLKAGEVTTDDNIDIDDAIAVGANFGTAQSGATDITGDGNVDIYDLVQIGRNYMSAPASSLPTCS